MSWRPFGWIGLNTIIACCKVTADRPRPCQVSPAPAGGHVDKLADRWTLAGIFSFLGLAFTLVGGLGWFVFSRPQAWARPAEAPSSKRLMQEEAAKLRKGRLPK